MMSPRSNWAASGHHTIIIICEKEGAGLVPVVLSSDLKCTAAAPSASNSVRLFYLSILVFCSFSTFWRRRTRFDTTLLLENSLRAAAMRVWVQNSTLVHGEQLCATSILCRYHFSIGQLVPKASLISAYRHVCRGVGGTWHGQGLVRKGKTRSKNLRYPWMVYDSTFDNRR